VFAIIRPGVNRAVIDANPIDGEYPLVHGVGFTRGWVKLTLHQRSVRYEAMMTVIHDFSRAVGQLGDPRFLRVMGVGLGIAIMLLIGATVLVQWLLPNSVSLPWIGEVAWASRLLSGFALVAMLGLSVVLMVPVASMFTGLFLDQVATAVEAQHYPRAPAGRAVRLRETLTDSAAFLGLMITVNLLALIVYLVFTPIAPILFWMVNGFLLGREYFQMVAMRHMERRAARALRRAHRFEVFAAGVLMAIPLTIPLINLVIPVLAVATFTHLFWRVRG